MLASIRVRTALALSEWRSFLRSRIFVVGGVTIPIVITVLLWFIILYLPETTADGTNRWDFLHSELKRYNDDVQGKYAFELSDDRFVYYVDDESGWNLAEAIRREILRRDIANFIEFINSNPRSGWKSWFSGTENDRTHRESLRTDSSRLSTNEFIEQYSIEHDSHRSYLLETRDKRYSWFVDGWNQYHKEIARQIPTLSFAKYVEVIDPNEEWHDSGVFKGYIHVNDMNLESTGRGSFFIYDPDTPAATKMRIWYQSLANVVLRERFQSSSIEENFEELSQSEFSLIIGLTTQATVKLRSSETRTLVKRVYSLVLFFAVIGGWCLLYFDRKLIKSEKLSPTYSSSVIDGRVFGVTLKVITFVAVWYILLVFPCFGLVGSNPSLGEGALGVFFHPLFILHWLLFLTFGVIGFGYVSHVASVSREVVTAITFFVILFITTYQMNFLATFENNVGICFLPIFGPFATVGLTSGLPELPMYMSIFLVTLVNLILLRLCCVFGEKRAKKIGKIKYEYAHTD